MKVVEKFLTENPCYRAGKTITVKGLMLHSVGCAQPSANAFYTAWNKASYTLGCVHAFIDANSGEVWQTLPWNMRGWHAGNPANNSYIGVEMCEPGTIVYPKTGVDFTDKDPEKSKAAVLTAYNAAVELFAYLCNLYKLDPLGENVILSHCEGCKRGLANVGMWAHVDPEHLLGRYGLTMDGFRAAVKAAMEPGAAAVSDYQAVQEKAGLSDKTMAFLTAYKYGDELLRKLAEAMRK